MTSLLLLVAGLVAWRLRWTLLRWGWTLISFMWPLLILAVLAGLAYLAARHP
jgi:hypothetical protein